MTLSRQLGPHIQRFARQYPVVTLTGPRQSGKTTLCRLLFPDYDYCNLEDLEQRQFAQEDPKGFLNQFKDGAILDEIQRAPDLPSYIQVIVDQENTPGRFILTGSQQFEITQSINQSLAGRTALATLLPLSLDELYPGKKPPELNHVLYQGSYPRIHDRQLNPSEYLSFYLRTYVERDIRTMINIRELSSFERFVRLCATQVGQLLNYTTLANDCGVDQKTVKSWLSILEASYIIYTVKPHFEKFRKRLVKSSKLYFYDVGLATYLLGIQQPDHLDKHPLRGLLFENFVMSELLKARYHQALDNNLYFFRDHTGNEVDVILDYGSELSAIEIKSAQTVKSDLLKNLHYYQKLSGDKLTHRYLIYGGETAYQREEVQMLPWQDAMSSISGS